MRKSLVLMMILVSIITFAFVSCDASTAPKSDILGEIIIADSQSRGISVTVNNTVNVDELYWYYKAVKNGGDIFNTGATDGFVPVKTVSNTDSTAAQGLSEANLGLFSYGNWTFTFYGVKEKIDPVDGKISEISSTLVLYSGTQTIDVNKNENFLNLTLKEGDGLTTSIVFDNVEGVWFTNNNIKSNMRFSLGAVDNVAGNETVVINCGTADVIDGKVSFKGMSYPAGTTPADGAHVMTFTLTQSYGAEDETSTSTVATYELRFTVTKGYTHTIKGDLTSAEVQGEVAIGTYAKSVPETIASLVLPVTSNSSKTVKAENQPIEVSTMDLTVKYPNGVKLTTDTNTAGSGDNVTADAKIGFKFVSNEPKGQGVSISATQDAFSYDLILNVDKENNEVLVEVNKFIGTGLEIEAVYHNGASVPKQGSAGLSDGAEYYDYDPTDGILKLYVKHASLIDVITKKTLAVAEIGDEKFTTLQAAIESAKDGDTVKLVNDVVVVRDNTISVDKGIVLDLNGYSITGKNERALSFVNGDSLITGTGIIKVEKDSANPIKSGSSVIRVGSGTNDNKKEQQDNVSLTIDENVTVSTDACYGVTVFGSDTAETVTIKGTISSYSGAVSGNGSEQYWGTNIVVSESASLTATNGPAIYHPQSGNLTVEGGTFVGRTAVEVKGGTVNIKGGVFNSNYNGTPVIDNAPTEDGGNSLGYALSVVEKKGYAGKANVTVSGGTFNSPVVNGKSANSPNTGKENTLKFTSDPTAYVSESSCVVEKDNIFEIWPALAQWIKTNGDTSNYRSVKDAVIARKTYGSVNTIKLLGDVTEDITLNGYTKLDLNGKTVNGNISIKDYDSLHNGTVNGTVTDNTTAAPSPINNNQNGIYSCTVTNFILADGCNRENVAIENSTIGEVKVGNRYYSSGSAGLLTFINSHVTGNITVGSQNKPYSGKLLSGWGYGSKVRFLGGTYEGTITLSNPNTYNNVIEIVNGTFTNNVNEDFLNRGSEVKEENGKFIVYKLPVAQVGDTTYQTIEAACAAAMEGDDHIVTVLVDGNVETTVDVIGDLVFDLKGHTVQAAPPNNRAFFINERGHLTIDDSSEAKTGLLESVSDSDAETILFKGGNSSLTVNSGTIKSPSNAIAANGTVKFPYSITINGGKVESTRNTVISLNAIAPVAFRMTGGELTTTSNYVIFTGTYGTGTHTFTFTGGTFKYGNYWQGLYISTGSGVNTIVNIAKGLTIKSNTGDGITVNNNYTEQSTN